MRVISGKYKGRNLKAVPGMSTRPTTDKVKESLFHRMGPYLDGGNVLDLFAGSGGLGIEALSRGADHVVFVDAQGAAVKTIHKNLETLKVDHGYNVFRQDAFRALKAASKQGRQFDYVFLDPPYGKVSFDKLFEALIDHKVLNVDAMIICEHDPNDKLPESQALFEKVHYDMYSNTIAVTVYRYEKQEDTNV
ncbi:16S rRNA (guanine966-N2)-methyltransferase [Alkalibacillus salilacus]|uniref:16S rRNA (Guanine966-N2)-methyltransferase n=2 Tax=Alkalibacillus salilacus TaxID=284582 RepID=A0ABT9VE25_9BACI|nr:16S rRNA (guanine(966)-N(2))-methyltransferase RsmD [Alkalibacillus salilacus]MDQ0159203.1 16S rRNA (guanine966-N2)-methyltransferase [Alkalibacillus salilacus]